MTERAKGRAQTMSAQHTPGPWVHATNYGQIGSVETEDGQIIAQAQKMRPRDKDQRNANARLIAAAPELLAALKNVTNTIRIQHSLQPEFGWLDWLEENILPIIAKAE